MRNTQIKYQIIIIFQYKIAEDVVFVFQSHYNYNKISIDNSPYRFVLQNNQQSSVYCFLALNMDKNNRAKFEVMSQIKIQSIPRSGLGKQPTLTGYSSGLTQFICSCFIYNCIKIYSTTIGRPMLLLFCLVLDAYVICELCIFQCWFRLKLKNELYTIL